MFNSIIARKLLIGLIPTLIVGFLCWKLYTAGFEAGGNEVQVQWDEAKIAHQEEVNKLKGQMADAQALHEATVRGIRDQLAQNSASLAAELAGIERDYAGRLHDYQNRAQFYERLSDAGAVERANLASYAAQLDRSLEEGRRLVGQLGATLRQRDSQLQLLGQQLRADRELTGTTTNE